MRFLFAVLLTSVGAAPAHAGCANYVDGSLSRPAPRAKICFKGVCEVTTLDFGCGNATSLSAGFANGWRISEDPKNGLVIERKGRRVPVSDHDKVQCVEIDPGGCDGSAV
ncbi:hypothetical protein [Mesorhizobium sp. L-8-3]|uniref:hypothetical protein n=1 Tax=Mesorhizobium sp. L-8-3 TaxID=2744522 RepID=UPI001928C89E|nr:hypothetical protein [Mesorhizobium sp. L-8-3]BCH23271.1 hypothetical protein MesoLjLb_30560 [Mesorhizobium sp. L-8-3]